MGMFSRKDKDKKKEEKKEESSAAPIQQQQQQQQEHPSLINPAPTAPPPAKENPISTEPTQQKSQNSWTDSAYQSYIGSSKSEEPQIRRQQEQKLQGHPPGTTVTTTTTTTTTVTTVSSDGRVHTQTFPYDPNTDPPVQTSETTSTAESSRARSIGDSSNTTTVSNPNSSTNIPQTQNPNQIQAIGATGLAPGPHGPERPEVQRTISPARKQTPQELESNTQFNVIPPTPQGSQSSKGPRSSAIDNSRIIPPRSERRVSPRTSFGTGNAIEPEPGFMPDGPLSPGPPMRSEKRNSIDRGLNVAPLKTSNSPSRPNSRPPSGGTFGQPLEQTYSGRSSYEAPPHPPPKDENLWHQQKQHESEYASPQIHPSQMHPAQREHSPYNTNNSSSNYIPVGGNSYDPLSPVSPTHPSPHSRSHTPTAAYPRPGPTVNSPSQSHFDAPPTSASAMHPPRESDTASMAGSTTTISSSGQSQPHKSHAYRQSFSQTMKGIQGASDVIRGTVNSNIARVTREKEEAERQRAIREKGMQDYRNSGLQEQVRGWGGRVPVGRQQDGSTRLRKRSLSRNGVHGSEGPGGLEPLEERSISSQ